MTGSDWLAPKLSSSSSQSHSFIMGSLPRITFGIWNQNVMIPAIKLITNKLELIFGSISLILGLFFVLMVPPLRIPDEPAHLLRVASIVEGQWIGHRATITDSYDKQPIQTSGFDLDPSWIWAGFTVMPPGKSKIEWSDFSKFFSLSWANKTEFLGVPNTSVYFPAFYIPAAIGALFTRWFGGQPWETILVGRLINLAIYTALGVAALRVAARGKVFLFCILTLPMSVSLGASLNPDGLTIGCATLSVALFTSTFETGSPARERRHKFWLATILVALIAITKPPLAALAGMVLVPFPLSWSAFRRWLPMRRLAAVLCAVIPAITWSVTQMSFVSAPIIRGAPYAPGSLYVGPQNAFKAIDAVAQIEILKAHPGFAVLMAWRDLRANFWPAIFDQIIGVLGAQTLLLPDYLYYSWLVAAVLSLIATMITPTSSTSRLSSVDSFFLLTCATTAVWGFYIVEYITWTPVGSTVVEGIQGRYFIPIAATAPLVLPYIRTKLPATIEMSSAAVPLIAALASLIAIPPLILLTWYGW